MMITKKTKGACKGSVCTLFLVLGLPVMLFAETIGVFFDTSVSQIKFAAGDVKAALESKSFTVEMLNLSLLASAYANKKVVIALSSNTAVAALLAAGYLHLPIA